MSGIADLDIDAQVRDLRRRVRTALGEEPADLLLRDCRVLNVHSEEIHPADIAILGDTIVAVRERFDGDAAEIVDCAGLYALPGFLQPPLPIGRARRPAAGVVAGGTTGVVLTGEPANTSAGDRDGGALTPRQLAAGPAAMPVAQPDAAGTDGSRPDVLRMLRAGGQVVALVEGEVGFVDQLAQVVRENIDTRYVCLGSVTGDVVAAVTSACRAGLAPIRAVQLATLNPATAFGLSHQVGSVTPGRLADLSLVTDLDQLVPELVYLGGQVAAERARQA